MLFNIIIFVLILASTFTLLFFGSLLIHQTNLPIIRDFNIETFLSFVLIITPIALIFGYFLKRKKSDAVKGMGETVLMIGASLLLIAVFVIGLIILFFSAFKA